MIKIINKKYYSQIFLINNKYNIKILNILKKIYNKENKNYCVLEIGSGLGNLSKEIIKNYKNFYLVEIDKNLVNILKNKFNSYKNNIINKNILNIKLNKLKYKKYYIIGNLPYNISSKIILWIIKYKKYINNCILLLQKEFVNSLISKINNKKRTKLSIILQYFFRIKKILNIKNINFKPIPKVNSTLILLINKNKKNINNINYKKLFFIIKEAFKYKRKILKNSLKNILINNTNDKIFLKRPEQLSIKEYIKIYNIIYENNNNK
ncbi:MAG: hypothetical protein RDO_0460 [Flavobacteriales endosymbiont of Rhyzopertha dominica]|nr:MAG: 16S rRNA (adenine(1518)-N(6)/adenine(1519)-N(6))-dimethyltransferase RsmA [Candidatus Shikimatogenerans bostrichidophilus]